MSSVINFILSHNEAVIQWLIVTIIALVALLVLRALFAKPKKEQVSVSASPAVSAAEIEVVLNKVMEKTKEWSAKAPATAGVLSEEMDAARKELSELKSALVAKEAELTKLKTEAAAAPTAAPVAEGGAPVSGGAGTAGYVKRIEELEAKLAEYSVLEDDIADLSLYKEENSRLKGELDRLRGGVAVDDGALQVPEPTPTEDLVKEFAEAVGKDKGPEDGVESLLAVEASQIEVPKAAADPSVEEPVAEATPEPVVAQEAPTPARTAEPAAPSAPATNADGEVDDLFAELASTNLDTDRMVAELADLQSLNTPVSADEALGGGVDPDKILAESGGS